jgi:hypothetical protein
MDFNVLLGPVDWPEQFRQDGFELSDVWGSDPMAGTNQTLGSHTQYHAHQNQHPHPQLQPQQRIEHLSGRQGYERGQEHGQEHEQEHGQHEQAGYRHVGYVNGYE